jgi:non-ribosomal peptide synthetase-like protein
MSAQVSVASLSQATELHDPLAALRRLEARRPPSILADASPQRWRFGERLSDVLEEACRRHADRIAVSAEDAQISYAELDARANRMARYFRSVGVKPGDRVAVMIDRGVEAYVALFGLLKAGAAYVPLDSNHPAERIGFIVSDAGATLVVAHLRLVDKLGECPARTLVLENARADVATFSDEPLSEAERPQTDDKLCYVLYTSGTTGKPKGVAVAHPSICNFVRVAAETYGFAPGDRVYQGMSVAFDFSIEEIWVPLVAGATLVPNTAATSLFGEELAEVLEAREVTCLACVPTLLASIDRDLPKLRILLIGGEACPPALVKRWSAPGRTLLNSYGPTETTVTATLGVMTPDKAVTIGRPLPTYTIVILDPAHDVVLAEGESGEIGIAGIGVAEGYLNRPELTQAKFIEDFLGLANNPSARIYRTGDLGRLDENGEIEYLGRIDTQIKLRGYRIELTEIESVLLELPEIAQAAVSTFEPAPGATELVAYYSVKRGATAPDRGAIVAFLRSRLPGYMTPAYLECLPSIPTLVSNKADRSKLPKPVSERLRFGGTVVAPETATEETLAEALQDALGLKEVSVEGDFFADYGAHSLLMARFCARVRQKDAALQVAMRDVYAHTTIRRLAGALDAARPAGAAIPELPEPHHPTDLAYYACGAAQTAAYGVFGGLAVAASFVSLNWIYAVIDSPVELYSRALAVAVFWFFAHTALAVATKWALIGRAKAGAIPVWSAAYFRFWAVKLMVRSAPVNAFAGTPLFNLYLRMLGAKIGRNAVIATRSVPVTADLLEVGEDALIMKHALMPGYSAYGNRIHTGPIRIGREAYVGEQSLVDFNTEIGDFGQLSHASSLQGGQRIPEGKSWHGSPAEETTGSFRLNDEMKVSSLKRGLLTAFRLVIMLTIAGAAAEAVIVYALAFLEGSEDAAAMGPMSAAVGLLPGAAWAAAAIAAAALVGGLILNAGLPRLLNLFLEEGRVYPLFGFHHALQQAIELLSNSAFFNLMFGDSIFIERYLRALGWKLAAGVETGSNFGSDQGHDNPLMCEIGANTVASDGLRMGNLTMSSHGFRLGASRVGADSFLGASVYVPPGARTGANVLYGSKVLVPADGPVRENVGLLGSPAFEIPRAAARDIEAIAAIGPAERARRLRMKTRRNIASIVGLVGSRWAVAFIGVYAFGWTAAVFGANDVLAMTLATGVVFMASLAIFMLMERASIGFGRLEPEMATVYDPAFWRIERHWKLSDTPLGGAFPGTPMRNVFSRLLGVKVGRKVFDDGCILSERTLVQIGDEANLNEHALIQAHSLEEGVFKSDYVKIGRGASIGVSALVHYGVTLGDDSHLDPDSFLMKGEIAPARSRWRGNPAKMVASRGAYPLP